jgi:hypothetical protein
MNAAQERLDGAACPSGLQLPFQCKASREALDGCVTNRKLAVMRSIEKVFSRNSRKACKHHIAKHFGLK